MLNTIWNLLPMNIKSGIGIGLILFIILIGSTLYYQTIRIDELKTSLLICKIEKDKQMMFFEEERIKAKTVIDNQNDKIKEYEINKDAYINAINKKEKVLIEERLLKQQQIDKELQLDSSADNQLRILTKLMKDFSNENN